MDRSMIKRFFLALAFAGLFSAAHGAGTIPFSLSQQLDQFGKPLSGCKFYTIQAGTTSTPQNAFQDSALTIPLPNPQTCDAAGRLTQMFLADGSIKVRLNDRNGVNVITADNIQVIGNSSGGGGGSPVDPTTILATGDIKLRYGTGVLTGFVRENGRTIGSSTSGATERANSDCQALFQYLWDTDPNLVVSTGRGASSSADWAANKTITLPDGRSRALAGLGDMGNTDNGILSGATFTTGNALLLGSTVGAARRTLLLPQLPTGITVSGSNLITVTGTRRVVTTGTAFIQDFPSTAGSGLRAPDNTSLSEFGISNGTNTITATSNNTSGSAFDTVSPYMVLTIYLKL